jgi:trimeric autotransporter adhesin
MEKSLAGMLYTGKAALLVVVAMLALSLVAAGAARASTTFTVNQTGDLGETILNGECDVFLPTAGHQCTLRAAIQEANVTPGKDTINFNIPGGGVQTIKPTSALPKIRDEVIIDGYSQPGASENTLAAGTNAVLKIELNGEGRPFPGLWILTSNSVVRGLVINRFDHIGIEIGGDDSEGNRIEGNFIGTNPAGTLDKGNLGRGVTIFSEYASANTVGGTTPDKRNLISGNDAGGVGILSAATDNVIRGNLIGTKKDGVGALGNLGSGVLISSAFENTVGGTTAEAANTIAFNEGDGVSIRSGLTESTGNRILRNSIFSNIDLFPDGLGIDLGDDGPTPNDPDDPDTGPNNLQNKPNLTSAVTASGSTAIEGSLNSTPNETFKVQFFSNPASSSEGKKYIGQKNVNTNVNGNTGTFSFSPGQTVPDGQNITAMATDANGNTSEFAAPEEVV